jgi:hypothetical protein
VAIARDDAETVAVAVEREAEIVLSLASSVKSARFSGFDGSG